MLFRTVYGPELETIYTFIADRCAKGHRPWRKDIHRAFIPLLQDSANPSSFKMGKTQNVDDALSFLQAAKLIEERQGYCATNNDGTPFRVKTLGAIRQLETGKAKGEHPTDALYSLLLTELFVKPNCLFVRDLHSAANQLRQVKEAGGLSKEKTQTWKRVMEFLGIGRRVAGGFLCAYTPRLVAEIIETWKQKQGTLQTFFETHFGQILPFERDDGDLADCVAAAFNRLMEQEIIALFPLQDSPSKPYFGPRRWKGIERKTDG